jgi:hypothetical protein
MNFEDEIEDAIICPNCNHEQELHVTPTVNVTLDPDMKEKVLSGEIFLFTCENCGFSGFAGFPFIYEDKETYGGFLTYMEPGCEDREVGVDGDIADQVLLQNMTMRLVTTINELKEKIFIFDAGLDDRVVELFKMLALSKMKADDASQIPDELRFSKMETVDGEEKMFFAAFSDEQYLGVLELPYALYQSCLITGEPIWDSPIHERGMVDQKWILDRLQSGVTENAESECDSCCDGDCDCCGK